MDLLELMRKRKSTRSFSSKEISNSDIYNILEAAISAPSGGNTQPWHFYVIKDQSIKQKLFEEAYPKQFLKDAFVNIVVCLDISRTKPRYGERGEFLYGIQDTAAAIQNMLLYATSIGISSCWIGAFKEEVVTNILNLNNELRPVAIIALGYEDVSSNKTPRRKVEEVSTFL